MIYFVYGNDSYRLKKTIDTMRQKYADSANMNTSVFDGEFDLEKIRSDVLSMPFLSEKRLVIIKNIFFQKGLDTKKVDDILDKKPNSTIILFTEEGVPDRRSSLFKRLVKEKAKEMNFLQGGELTRWIKSEAEKQGGAIETKEADIMAEYFGGDLWQLKNEIQKLITLDKKITEENIEKLCRGNVNVKIFDLTDAITNKNVKTAFRVLADLLISGENELRILSMIQWQMRNLALVYDLKNLSEGQIASKLGIKPFVAGKSLRVARALKSNEMIKEYYKNIIETENDIKTGAKDPDVALELLVNKLTD